MKKTKGKRCRGKTVDRDEKYEDEKLHRNISANGGVACDVLPPATTQHTPPELTQRSSEHNRSASIRSDTENGEVSAQTTEMRKKAMSK